ncbi:GIY-YIG nuclease family protein [Aequorivita capsosiphonis]|uniref:GIY-YIG nuclease family protein n=1 Tax=Aequorivita capsosiphonis TaxID=487317 RepID=UPI00047B0575|nr:GIY-YIG nuclease family protein [Aequorivita capsosiphonis]
MYYVYILNSQKDGRLYKGLTDNLEKRVHQHNLGQNKSTKGFLPWSLAYYEEFQTRIETRAREKYFKSGEGREFLKGKLNL